MEKEVVFILEELSFAPAVNVIEMPFALAKVHSSVTLTGGIQCVAHCQCVESGRNARVCFDEDAHYGSASYCSQAHECR
jgi:hypothetical protein